MTKRRLLVIDDSESNTLLIKSLFEERGDYIVEVLCKSASAIDKMLKSIPDVVILDLMMPQVDGFEILSQMKKNDELKHIPVIIVSAWDSVENIKKAKDLGACEYLSKPISLTEIYEMVEKHQ